MRESEPQGPEFAERGLCCRPLWLGLSPWAPPPPATCRPCTLGSLTVRCALPPRFATRERNALLLYNGRFNEKHDFIALEVVDEQVQLTFSAGEAPAREGAALGWHPGRSVR